MRRRGDRRQEDGRQRPEERKTAEANDAASEPSRDGTAENPPQPRSNEVKLVWRDQENETHAVTGEVLDSAPQGAVIALAEAAPMQQTLKISGTLSYTAIVRNCRREQTRYIVTLDRLSKDRRGQRRTLTRGKATANFRGALGTDASQAVEIRDITAKGLCMESDRAFQVGERVVITSNDYRCVGTARYCNPAGRRFVIGVAFDAPPEPVSR